MHADAHKNCEAFALLLWPPVESAAKRPFYFTNDFYFLFQGQNSPAILTDILVSKFVHWTVIHHTIPAWKLPCRFPGYAAWTRSKTSHCWHVFGLNIKFRYRSDIRKYIGNRKRISTKFCASDM